MWISFFYVKAEYCDSPDKKWTACENNSDCVIHDDICGGWIAYNSKFLKSVDAYNKCMQPAVKCAPYYNGPKKEDLTAKCIDKKCKSVRGT